MLLQFILITHPKTGDQRDSLRHIYNLYVEYVVKNPLYVPGTPIQYISVFQNYIFLLKMVLLLVDCTSDIHNAMLVVKN
jgi:Sybindin-like family